MTTGMDVPALLRDGDEVAEVGDRLARAALRIRDWEYAARGAVPGSTTSESALAGTARAWETTLSALAIEVRDFGAGLSQAALDHREADAAAAARVRGAR